MIFYFLGSILPCVDDGRGSDSILSIYMLDVEISCGDFVLSEKCNS